MPDDEAYTPREVKKDAAISLINRNFSRIRSSLQELPPREGRAIYESCMKDPSTVLKKLSLTF
jgi:hypothetical protein